LKDFPPAEAEVFFVDYKFRKSVATKYKAIDDEFVARNRGPLGIIGVAEITVGVQDFEGARSKWGALVAPSPQISEDVFVFNAGPRIRLVRAESPGIQGIVLSARSLGEAENRMRQGSDGQTRLALSIVRLKDFPPTEADVLFVDYKFRKSVATKYKAIDDEFVARNRGPLGIIGAAEITVGVQDLEEARRKWSALLAPSPQISDDTFVFDSGPRIRLVRAESPGIQGIILSVRSLDEAEKFLKERDLLARDDAGNICISPAAIDGLSVRLVEAAQAQGPAHPLLGRGLGVDHVGIAVRDLEKNARDYEQGLGFKCIERPPQPSGIVSSIIYFENTSYLELLSVSEKPSGPPLSDQAKRYADFAEKSDRK